MWLKLPIRGVILFLLMYDQNINYNLKFVFEFFSYLRQRHFLKLFKNATLQIHQGQMLMPPPGIKPVTICFRSGSDGDENLFLQLVMPFRYSVKLKSTRTTNSFIMKWAQGQQIFSIENMFFTYVISLNSVCI